MPLFNGHGLFSGVGGRYDEAVSRELLIGNEKLGAAAYEHVGSWLGVVGGVGFLAFLSCLVFPCVNHVCLSPKRARLKRYLKLLGFISRSVPHECLPLPGHVWPIVKTYPQYFDRKRR